jgi:hypothetical protein
MTASASFSGRLNAQTFRWMSEMMLSFIAERLRQSNSAARQLQAANVVACG